MQDQIAVGVEIKSGVCRFRVQGGNDLTQFYVSWDEIDHPFKDFATSLPVLLWRHGGQHLTVLFLSDESMRASELNVTFIGCTTPPPCIIHVVLDVTLIQNVRRTIKEIVPCRVVRLYRKSRHNVGAWQSVGMDAATPMTTGNERDRFFQC
jgi:hypothetical protein